MSLRTSAVLALGIASVFFRIQLLMQIPSSLQNIYKEIHSDVGCSIPQHGHLEAWVKQGVLLLNTSLTVEVCA